MITSSRQYAVGSRQLGKRPIAGGVFAKISSDLRLPTSAFRNLPTAHCPLPTRRGISLLEVLIAIFIVAVGLLSIASLLPIGSIQLEKAGIEERKATLGINALRDFQTRDCTNPQNWVRETSAPYLPILMDPTNQYLPDATWVPPLVIDPQMLAQRSCSTKPIRLHRPTAPLIRRPRKNCSFSPSIGYPPRHP